LASNAINIFADVAVPVSVYVPVVTPNGTAAVKLVPVAEITCNTPRFSPLPPAVLKPSTSTHCPATRLLLAVKVAI
jgi:hypothetical protein